MVLNDDRVDAECPEADRREWDCKTSLAHVVWNQPGILQGRVFACRNQAVESHVPRRNDIVFEKRTKEPSHIKLWRQAVTHYIPTAYNT
jgi:hypothetical protein